MILQIALRNLLQQRRRAIVLASALAGVTALLLLLLSLLGSIETALFDNFTALFTGHVNVEGFYKVTPGRAFPAVTNYPKLVELIRHDFPEVTDVVPRVRSWVRVSSPTRSWQMAVQGVDIQSDRRLRTTMHVLKGNLADLAQPDTILLFDFQATKLGVDVGDTVTLSGPVPRGSYNTVDVRVVAIARSLGGLSETVSFVPSETLRHFYGLSESTTGVLQLYVSDLDSVDSLNLRLRDRLAKAGYTVLENDPRIYFEKTDKVESEDWVGARLDVTTYKASIDFFGWLLTIVRGLSFGLVSVLLSIILVGLLNSLWIAIRERTPEIGTMRAIGLQRGGVVRMVLYETLSLGLIGSLLGTVIGLIATAAINALHIPIPPSMQGVLMAETLRLRPSLLSALSGVALITFWVALASLWPSWRAARLRPIIAMQQTG